MKTLGRNITISTKVTAVEKVNLVQLAGLKSITPAELYYTLIIGSKDHYDHIGEGSPFIKKLKADLEKVGHELEQKKNELAVVKEKCNKLQTELGECKNMLSSVKIAFLNVVTSEEKLM